MCTVDKPIFFVMGATGTGKSKVAVEFATLLKTEFNYSNVVIVNCDVSQFYVDLPIATNMSRSTELCGIKHVFMGFLTYDNKLLHSPEDAFVGYDLMNVEERTCSPKREAEELQKEPNTECVTFNITKYIERVEAYIKKFFAEHDNSAVIVCGGTCYYLQALLFDGMLTLETNEAAATDEEEALTTEKVNNNNNNNINDNLVNSDISAEHTINNIDRFYETLTVNNSNNEFNGTDSNIHNDSCETINCLENNTLQVLHENEEEAMQLTISAWDRLNAVDPLTANRYHPNDTRRIQRLLDIYRETGRPPSEIFAKRNVKLRWNASSLFVIWTDIERKLLTKRLNERVDDMVYRGLFSEVYALHTRISENDVHSTLTKAIGFKELRHVLTANDAQHANLSEEYSSAVYFALNEMKINTHHYARQQIRWIKNRILPLLSDLAQRSGNVVIKKHVVKIDLTCGIQWRKVIEDVAKTFFIKNREPASTMEDGFSFPLLDTEIKVRPPLTRHICDECGALIYGDEQIIIHKQSQRHRRAMKRLAKRDEHEGKLSEITHTSKRKKEEPNLKETA